MSFPELALVEEDLAFLDDWEDRYRYLIDLGKGLSPFPDHARTNEQLVRGCQSQVWLLADLDDAGRLRLQLDSDALIVRGLTALVGSAYHGRTPAEALAFDIEALFDRLQLLRHLSATRGNGLRAMVGRIREHAASLQVH
ncbi:MAG: SufE family protein [Pseudomonadota bacterium]